MNSMRYFAAFFKDEDDPAASGYYVFDNEDDGSQVGEKLDTWGEAVDDAARRNREVTA